MGLIAKEPAEEEEIVGDADAKAEDDAEEDEDEDADERLVMAHKGEPVDETDCAAADVPAALMAPFSAAAAPAAEAAPAAGASAEDKEEDEEAEAEAEAEAGDDEPSMSSRRSSES